MDKVIDQSLKDSTVGIVGQIEAVVGHLDPAAHRVVLDEVHAVFQEQDEVCPMFHRADSIVLIKPCPTGAEYARLKYSAVIHKQQSGIGQLAVKRDQPKRLQVLVVPFLMRLFAERISKDDEGVFVGIHLRRERIPRHVRTFQNQREELLRIALHAFIADPNKSRTCPVLIIIIRCQHSSLDFHFKQGTSFVFNRYKLHLRHRVKPCLYHFTDKIGICLHVLQSYDIPFIIYAIEQAAAICIGKGRYGFEPRLLSLSVCRILHTILY